MTKKVDVMLVDKPGAGAGQSKCKVAKLDEKTDHLETHHIRTQPGEVIEWVVSNKSRKETMTVGIGNFRTSPGRIVVAPQDANQKVENPFDGGCAQTVTVQPGTTVTLSCQIKQRTYRPRTYKYDIIDKGKNQVMLDPEIEIV